MVLILFMEMAHEKVMVKYGIRALGLAKSMITDSFFLSC